MTYEERIKSICSECIGCPYKSKNLEHKCEYLANVMHGWKFGFSDAIEKAYKFFNKRMCEVDSKYHDTYVMDKLSSSIKEFIEDFKKYTEEQQ